MSTAAYRDWVRDGRPVSICGPAAIYREMLWANGWDVVDVGTVGNEEHLQAEFPQDHTPFSATGWPLPNPYPWVHAIDVMHDPTDGRDVAPLAEYWLSEARAGRTPWVKYIVWQGNSYSVRTGWQPQSARGHFDHAHISFRTDHTRATLGGWSVFPNGGNNMTVEEANMHKADTWRTLAILTGTNAFYQLEGEPEPRNEVNEPWLLLKRLEAAAEVLLSRTCGSGDPQAVANALAGNQAFIQALSAGIVEELKASGSATDLILALGQAIVRGAEG